MTTKNQDIKAIYYSSGLYKNGYLIEPITESGIKACKDYKGVKMNKFFIPVSLFADFQVFANYRNLNLIVF